MAITHTKGPGDATAMHNVQQVSTFHRDIKELTARVNTENPDPQDIARLRRMYESDPNLCFHISNMADAAIENVIQCVEGNELVRDMLRMNVRGILQNLGYDVAPTIQQLLIQQVAMSWLRLTIAENLYDQFAGSGDFRLMQYWEKRLTATQRRYLRVIESLARIRKIPIRKLQMNIAVDGGKQINIAD